MCVTSRKYPPHYSLGQLYITQVNIWARGLASDLMHNCIKNHKMYILWECSFLQLLKNDWELEKERCSYHNPTPTLHTSNVVSSIPCKSVHIGQTGRLLKSRVDEHKTAVKYARTGESAVAENMSGCTSIRRTSCRFLFLHVNRIFINDSHWNHGLFGNLYN